MENAAVSLEAAPASPGTSPRNDQEARAELLNRAHRKTGSLPAALLVDHVLAVTKGAAWPVRREALDAVLRRLASMEADALQVAARPEEGSVFGAYVARKPRTKGPVHEQVLRSVVPLDASCACPDFLRNSLGVCKHVLAVLDGLARAPRRFSAAVTARAADPAGAAARLAWNPLRPLTGPGPWWERLALVPAAGERARAPLPGFIRDRGGAAVADAAAWADPQARRRLVLELLTALDRRDLVADPAPAALLREELQGLDRRGILAESEVRAHLRTLKRKLYPYQVEGVTRMMVAGRLLLADDMGLGKTAQAIATAHVLSTSGRVKRGLVVTPASLKPQWEREWNLFTGVPVAIVEGGPEARAGRYRECESGFLIANYEQVIRDAELIRAWDPDLVILDEAQRIKNWETKTAGAVKRLDPRWRLVLTGTPMENRLGELASIMDWVDNHALEPKWRLAPLHAVVADGAREVVGAAGLDTLRARLAPGMLRRLRTEVLSQLPSRTDTVVPVELTPPQAEEHHALTPSIAALVHRASRRPLTQGEFLKLMQLLTVQRMLANGIALRDFEEVWPGIRGRAPLPAVLATLATPKLSEFREITNQVLVQQGRRMVVFSQWRRMLELAHWAVSDILQGGRLRAAFFSGQESLRQRTRNIVDFHDDPATRVLFATDAGGVGLNLQRAASCCVNLDLPWNPAVLEQRIGRIHRLGQTDPIDVYNLVSQGCIEERILKLVADKRALFRGLFDGTSDEVVFERSGSFLDTVTRLVAPPDAAAGSVAAPAAGAEAREDLDPRAEDEVLADALSGPEPAPGPEIVPAAADPSGLAARDPGVVAGAPEPAPIIEPARSTGPSPDRSLSSLFTRIAVRRTAAGGLSLEADPEDAVTLASVFEGLAGLLRQAAAES